MAYARSYDHPAFAGDLADLFRRQLRACALAQDEICACITDTAWTPAYAAACMSAATSLGAQTFQTVFGWNAAPPARPLRAACEAADLIVYMTTHALHYTDEIRQALARGARVLCTMEPPHVLDRLRFDPDVRQRALAGAKELGKTKQVRITSAAGTDLTMDKSGRGALANYGAADMPGHLDFWGLGAVQAAQLEGTTEGRLVLDVGDCVFHLGRHIASPVTIDFEQGRIVSIDGGLDARLIRDELDSKGENAFLAGHMAWGVDPRARWTQPITQTPDTGGGGADIESYAGTVQVQIGSNDDVCFDGQIRSRAHLGLCLRDANIYLDGRPMISEGKICV